MCVCVLCVLCVCSVCSVCLCCVCVLCVCVCVCYLVAKLCPILCNLMDCSPPGSSVHGILQARILEWVAIPPPRDLPISGTEPRSSALQADSLPLSPLRSVMTTVGGKYYYYFHLVISILWMRKLRHGHLLITPQDILGLATFVLNDFL